MTDSVRIIYHPAPGPTVDGKIAEVEPIDLGTDADFALEWIRQRLGLGGQSTGELLRFRDEIVPMPEATLGRLPAAGSTPSLTDGLPGEPAVKASKPNTPRRSRSGHQTVVPASKADPMFQSPASNDWEAPVGLSGLPTFDEPEQKTP